MTQLHHLMVVKNKEQKTRKSKGKEKKHQKKKQQNVAQDSNEGSSDDENAKQRLRHKMSIPKVYELMNSVNGKRRKQEIIDELNDSGFGGLLHICNWTRIHTFFVDWVVRNFDKENMCIVLSKTEGLPLKEEDVHRVYELPMEGKDINVDLCSNKEIEERIGTEWELFSFCEGDRFGENIKDTRETKSLGEGCNLFYHSQNYVCITFN